MKNKELIVWIMMLIILGVLIFATPALGSRISSVIWFLFIFIVIAVALIKVIYSTSNTRKSDDTLKISNQSILIRILFILFLISAIYEIINYNSVGILSTAIILVLLIVKFVFKKEE